MLANLAGVDRINSLMALIGRQMIEEVRAEKLGLRAGELANDRLQLIEGQRTNRGMCVRSDLPLDLD